MLSLTVILTHPASVVRDTPRRIEDSSGRWPGPRPRSLSALFVSCCLLAIVGQDLFVELQLFDQPLDKNAGDTLTILFLLR